MKIEQIRKTIKETRKELKELEQNLKNDEKKLEIELLNALKNIKTFTRQDIFKLFPNQSKEELVKILKRMIREGKVQSIGRDFYSMDEVGKELAPSLSKDMEEIRILLNENGIDFMITGLDILNEYVNLIPKRIPHLIYVVRGSGELASDLIQKKINRICIINPTRKEVRNLMSHYAEDLIIIREVGESSIEYHKEGIATIEKAMVDLYFETTRKRIPLDIGELASILRNILPIIKIDYRRLLRAATRRNMQSEFVKLLNAMKINIPTGKIKEHDSERVDKVIKLLR